MYVHTYMCTFPRHNVGSPAQNCQPCFDHGVTPAAWLAHVPINVHVGWLQLVGSLKLQVSFAEYSLFYRALLQKRPITLRSLLIVATP